MSSIMKIILLGLLLIAGSLDLDSSSLAAYGQEVVTINIADAVFSVPFYQTAETPLYGEAKGFYDTIAFRLHREAQWLIDTLLGGNLAIIHSGASIRTQGPIEMQHECSQFAINQGLEQDPQFKADMVGILDDLIHRDYLRKSSSGFIKSKKSKDKKAKARENLESYLQRLKLIFDGAYQLAIHSPVSLHLDYRRMTIDGNLAVREIDSIFQRINEARLTYQRYPVVFEFLNTIIKNI